ncbi:class I SAM-dependent methyltransferase [Leptothoe spongobia]|uniref:Class I SAM-dependent methyltransferase n=1 Tax=Leptothoe spongobia TAU-MAC 1115 TaxID=1967444 RepID=A0A947DHP6_9CYAN|nr:class I SAM-dependent methyltransferase [Leptothoe spongobia]MBT9317258.1 class I SAM-dependent methyltransferase [Leptothoe spongobia TAU-MAC 1115]
MHSLSEFSLKEYCLSDKIQYSPDKLAVATHLIYTQGMLANAYFFGHPIWAKKDFQRETHNHFWKSRWQKVIPSWDDKVVVDIGCGLGHVLATMGGNPAIMIGVDISLEALKNAQKLGYTPLLADAQDLPLKSGFADIVTLNATLHHCDNIERTLSEAARLVKPGGLLITDLDPQKTAWELKGLGLLLNQVRRRVPMYWLMRFSRYRSRTEINMRLATELHNANPGDGLTPQLYNQVLAPLGFQVRLYPHNHNVGDDVLIGHLGQIPWHYQLTQWLSGIQPNQKASAQSIMCVAQAAFSVQAQ